MRRPVSLPSPPLVRTRDLGVLTPAAEKHDPLRTQGTPPAGDPRAPHLPAQVAEADVQLVLLAGLPLVSAAVLCGGTGGAETRISPPAHAAVSAGAWPLRHKRCSGTRSPRTRFHPLRAVPPPARAPGTLDPLRARCFSAPTRSSGPTSARIPWGNQSPSTPHAATGGCPEGSASDRPRCGRQAAPRCPPLWKGQGRGQTGPGTKPPAPPPPRRNERAERQIPRTFQRSPPLRLL